MGGSILPLVGFPPGLGGRGRPVCTGGPDAPSRLGPRADPWLFGVLRRHKGLVIRHLTRTRGSLQCSQALASQRTRTQTGLHDIHCGTQPF